jgi:2-dehydro-3-deoxyglucarate aldolase
MESILAVEGVDGFIVGPYDLSASLGVPGEFEHPEVKRALKRIREVVKQATKAPGFHVIQPQAELVTNCIMEGYRFIAFSLDILFLGHQCRTELAALRASIQ